MKTNLKVRFECPHCRQIDDDIPLGKRLDIVIDNKYIGSGEWIPVVEGVYIDCTGCKKSIDIELS